MRRLSKPVLYGLAAVFAVAALLYAVLWTVYGSRGNPVELGFEDKYLPSEHADLVQMVHPGSPAEHAGLKAGDRIIAVAGLPLAGEDTMPRIWHQHHPGDTIGLTVLRPGSSSPILLHGIFRLSESGVAEAGAVTSVGLRVLGFYPFVFLTVGFAVLFLRIDDPHAWLVALLFSGFMAIPNPGSNFLRLTLVPRLFAICYQAIFENLVPAVFYFFFAIFPERSPIDRRLPWLKWLGIAFAVTVITLELPIDLNRTTTLYPAWLLSRRAHLFISSVSYLLIALGFASLIWNDLVVASSDARRKIRVIMWGTLVGVVPATLLLAANEFFGYSISILAGSALVLLLWLFPLAFAYAVVKHRVLEIPVLLRRSARYLLVQRGFVILLIAFSIAVTLAFSLGFSRYLETKVALPGAIALGSIFGSVLLWTGVQVHKDVGRRIDRAFFRSAYDARVVMEQLLAKTRTATTRDELAALLEYHLREALHPSSGAVYLESRDAQLALVAGNVPPECEKYSPAEPAFRELAKYGKPWDVSSSTLNGEPLPSSLLVAAPECLVPIPGRDGRLVGLIVLGPRLSEEPYSGEDKRLLLLIANQVGVALDSILLAENIAERMEGDRRTAQELEFARQVQARLLPQKLPAMRTLEYVGGCLSARQVGGDYYDFLELRPERLGMVLADIAGKGVAGALLMANLQANLRSQYAVAVEDLPRLLASVNRLFFHSTDQSSYATLFFADYDDATHRLRYANCGHLPGLLLHADGNSKTPAAPVWLDSTCTVLGLFEELPINVSEVSLAPGDILALYTDGVTEAVNEAGEEFGEGRLVDALRGKHNLSAQQLLQAVFDAVGRFSPGEQQDDITLVIARCIG
jgi:phosphoserine phosphatase RsbU/P